MPTPESSRPVPVSKLCGEVSAGMHGEGSKSEHRALFIETPKGRFILRRKGGPAFADATLECYLGHTVECDGFLLGSTLLCEQIRIVE
ncbi:MAG TPA: hypothetical protein VLC92_11870 [Rhodocyclaceae bacterium]|nr:hypothetical protein [Rhodocyclaceae bacterium]